MVGLDQLLLAVITGIMFGWFVSLLGSSPQRLALMLFALWLLMSVSQQLYRALSDSIDITDEIIFLVLVRGSFAIAAVLTVWLIERRRPGDVA